MDTKALAKSKRAHSLHHSKKHNPHQAPKAPSASSGDKKPTGKLPKAKPLQPRNVRPLPSNWDRYNDDFDMGPEDTAKASPSQPIEFVAPKSKGADYAHLISEARGQAQAFYPSDAFPFSEDNICSFSQDFGPMLAAKGQNILSWIMDDGFEYESKPSSNLEVPFLSLNLDALAEQLAKSKLSDRLFLETDLLPLELLDNELQTFSEDKHDPQTCASGAVDTRASLLTHNQRERKDAECSREPLLSHDTVSKNFPVQIPGEGLNSTKQIKDENLLSERSYGSIKSAARNPSTSEMASAEAELDMLLNSFGETKIFELPSASTSSFSAASAESMQKGAHTAKPVINATNLDDAIDNLLEETSGMTKTDGSHQPHGVKVGSRDASSTVQSSSKSKLLDDFDSWLDTI